MKKLYLLAFLGISVFTHGQRFDWVKFVSPVNTALASGSARDLVRDASGNMYSISLFDQPLLVGEETVTPTVANQNMILVKWDASGNVLAHKKLQCGGGGFMLHQLTFDETNDDLLVAFDISAGGPINIDDETAANGDNTVAHIFRFESDLTFKSDLPHLHTYYLSMAAHEDHLYYAHGYQSTIYKKTSKMRPSGASRQPPGHFLCTG